MITPKQIVKWNWLTNRVGTHLLLDINTQLHFLTLDGSKEDISKRLERFKSIARRRLESMGESPLGHFMYDLVDVETGEELQVISNNFEVLIIGSDSIAFCRYSSKLIEKARRDLSTSLSQKVGVTKETIEKALEAAIPLVETVAKECAVRASANPLIIEIKGDKCPRPINRSVRHALLNLFINSSDEKLNWKELGLPEYRFKDVSYEG